MKCSFKLTSLVPLAFLCALASLPAHAGDGKTSTEPAVTTPKASPWQFSSDLSLDYSYAGGGRTEGKSISAQNGNAEYVLTSRYNEGAPIRLGGQWQEYWFGGTSGTQVPNTLHSEAVIAGVDLEVFDAIFIRIEAQPGFYSASSNFSGKSFNVPVIVGGSYLYNKDVQLVLGVSIDPVRNYPVLPGGGIRWQINEHWLLNAVLPKPRLEYEFSKQFTVYGGANFQETSFRTDHQFGTATGSSKLNSAWLDYTEVRVGTGATLKVNDKINVDLEAGYVVYRDFDYHRAGIDLHSNEGGVYGGISIGAKF